MSNSRILETASVEFWDQLRISAYFAVGTAGMVLWDIVANLKNDYYILSRKMFAIPTLTYFFCRLSMLSIAILDAIFLTISTTKCQEINHIMQTFLFISVSTTTLLFYLRLKAIYQHNRPIVVSFFLLWVLTIGCCTLILWEGKISSISDPITHQPVCFYIDFDLKTGVLALNAILVHDTLVFLAVSYRLFKNSYLDFDEMTRTRMGSIGSDDGSDYSVQLTKTMSKTKEFISGKNLPAFSRALLRNGQVYYLISLLATVITNVVLCTPFKSFSIPGMKSTPGIHVMLFIPHATIISAMSCHVFRQVRFGLIHEHDHSEGFRFGPSLPIWSTSSDRFGFAFGREQGRGWGQGCQGGRNLKPDIGGPQEIDSDEISRSSSMKGERGHGSVPTKTTCYIHQTVERYVDDVDVEAEVPGPLPAFTTAKMHRRATVSEWKGSPTPLA